VTLLARSNTRRKNVLEKYFHLAAEGDGSSDDEGELGIHLRSLRLEQVDRHPRERESVLTTTG
jgi:hypothetical protein